MREKLEQRLDDLREESAKGIDLLHHLQQQQADLEAQLVRIGGAIQVLEELIAEADQRPADIAVVRDNQGAEGQ